MTIICPACRKPNESAPDACARCGCDLTGLGSVHRAAEECLTAAAGALRQGHWVAAGRQAERSWSLRHSPAAARLAFLAAAAAGQTLRAMAWHTRAARTEAA